MYTRPKFPSIRRPGDGATAGDEYTLLHGRFSQIHVRRAPYANTLIHAHDTCMCIPLMNFTSIIKKQKVVRLHISCCHGLHTL